MMQLYEQLTIKTGKETHLNVFKGLICIAWKRLHQILIQVRVWARRNSFRCVIIYLIIKSLWFFLLPHKLLRSECSLWKLYERAELYWVMHFTHWWVGLVGSPFSSEKTLDRFIPFSIQLSGFMVVKIISLTLKKSFRCVKGAICPNFSLKHAETHKNYQQNVNKYHFCHYVYVFCCRGFLTG